jgi:predicted nucleotidyltransferase
MTASENTFAPLRRRERERRIAALRQRLRDTLGTNDCSVGLFGSLARGDWDGFSDTDLLVVAANQDEAERAADQLIAALVGDDVLAIDHERWQAIANSPSPHWRAIRAQAIRLYPEP